MRSLGICATLATAFTRSARISLPTPVATCIMRGGGAENLPHADGKTGGVVRRGVARLHGREGKRGWF